MNEGSKRGTFYYLKKKLIVSILVFSNHYMHSVEVIFFNEFRMGIVYANLLQNVNKY